MKKGFTMIELIFVIVILGILASVAIPRLSATRVDAEITATIANLRTMQSEIGMYLAVNGAFPTEGLGRRIFSEMTNVKIENQGGNMGSLKIGNDSSCIGLVIQPGEDTEQLYTPDALCLLPNESSTDSVCKQVLSSQRVRDFIGFKVNGQQYSLANGVKTPNGTRFICNGIAFGSTAKIY